MTGLGKPRQMKVVLVGAGGSGVATISGPGACNRGFELGKGQVSGLYHAPVETEWGATRRQRGGSFKGIDNPARDMQLGFQVHGSRQDPIEVVEDRLRSMFSYHLDPWDKDDTLARIQVHSVGGIRWLSVQMISEPEFAPDIDPTLLQYGNVFHKLRAAQPFWESDTEMTSWETSGTSGSGEIEVWNPTDIPMYQRWVLTPGTWTVPDPQWSGPKRHRVPGNRQIVLRPVTSAMGALVIDLDPTRVMMADAAGTNVMGQVGGGYYFLHEIPPHTPRTMLPISVTGAPAGGARAELHQPRLWSSPWGGQ